MGLTISDSIQILKVGKNSSLDEIIKNYYEEAKKYHPDAQDDLRKLRNAHEMMIMLNEARGLLEKYWKDNSSFEELFLKKGKNPLARPIITDELTLVLEKLKERYLFHRERAKKGVYIYYRYNLQRLPLRGSGTGMRWYLEYKRYLKKALNDIYVLLNDSLHLKKKDETGKINEYYNSFMIGYLFFEAFYRAAECTIFSDPGEPIWEKQVFSQYLKGCNLSDKVLGELFLRKAEGLKVRFDIVKPGLLDASAIFSYIIKNSSQSSWVKETNIKGQLVLSSVAYINEFY